MPSPAGRVGLVNFDTISPGTTALIVIDMQVIFLEPAGLLAIREGRKIAGNINALADAVRRSGGTVAYTLHTVTDAQPFAMPDWVMADPRLKAMWNMFRAESPGHGLDACMKPQPEDIILNKHRYSAFPFNSSRLKEELDARGIDTVIVVGVATNVCCETTTRDASQLGYKAFFVSDATAAATDAEHDAALITLGSVFADMRTTTEMLELIAHAKRL